MLEPGTPPILPDPLPSCLEEVEFDTLFSEPSSEGDVVLDPRVGIPGPPFDASVLPTTQEQVLFNRNLAAVTAVLAGMGVSKVAHAYEMGKSSLARLVRRTKELGQIACVPYATYHRERAWHPELQQLIRKLYTHPIRPSVMAVYEDAQLTQLAEELSEPEHKHISAPTQNLHLRASHPGGGRSSGDRDPTGPCLRSNSTRDRRSPLYLGHPQVLPPSCWHDELNSGRSWSL